MAKDFTPSASNRAAYDKMTDIPVTGTVPPQALELEEAVLGALMLESDSIIAVQEYITADAFYTEEHRLIYKAVESLSAELKPIDLYTVTERLKVRKELKKVGGAAYLAQLTQKVGSAANVEFHAKIIAQKYVQRELIRSATEIQRRSYDEDQDVTDLIGFAESEIFKVAEGHVKRSVQNAKDILAKALAQIEEASKNTSAFNGVPSGRVRNVGSPSGFCGSGTLFSMWEPLGSSEPSVPVVFSELVFELSETELEVPELSDGVFSDAVQAVSDNKTASEEKTDKYFLIDVYLLC